MDSTWNDDTFSRDPGVMLFYAKWCGFCKTTKDNINRDMILDQYPGKFRMHNAGEDLKVKTEWSKYLNEHGITNISKFPTFILIDKNHTMSIVDLPRTTEGVMHAIENHCV